MRKTFLNWKKKSKIKKRKNVVPLCCRQRDEILIRSNLETEMNRENKIVYFDFLWILGHIVCHRIMRCFFSAGSNWIKWHSLNFLLPVLNQISLLCVQLLLETRAPQCHCSKLLDNGFNWKIVYNSTLTFFYSTMGQSVSGFYFLFAVLMMYKYFI